MVKYIETKQLESVWHDWLNTQSSQSWEKLNRYVYDICNGVVIHFNPPTPEYHQELTHNAFVAIIDKIYNIKIIYEPGKGSVFNLLTTAIFRHLYSLKNKTKRRKQILQKLENKSQCQLSID